jgi:hypothetical protein
LQKEFLERIVSVLESNSSSYAVSGSIASNYRGIPRFTHDLDILVVLTALQARQIAAAFPEPYYTSADAAAQAVRSQSMFNILDTTTGLKVDLWISKGDPFSLSMLQRRLRVNLLHGIEVFVGSAEDVLLHKLVWHTIAPSQRQLADAAELLRFKKKSSILITCALGPRSRKQRAFLRRCCKVNISRTPDNLGPAATWSKE